MLLIHLPAPMLLPVPASVPVSVSRTVSSSVSVPISIWARPTLVPWRTLFVIPTATAASVPSLQSCLSLSQIVVDLFLQIKRNASKWMVHWMELDNICGTSDSLAYLYVDWNPGEPRVEPLQSSEHWKTHLANCHRLPATSLGVDLLEVSKRTEYSVSKVFAMLIICFS